MFSVLAFCRLCMTNSGLPLVFMFQKMPETSTTASLFFDSSAEIPYIDEPPSFINREAHDVFPSRWMPGADVGMCYICFEHCPEQTEPQPQRSWRLSSGRMACALCYKFERTRNAARRVSTSTCYYRNIMVTLQQMEAHINELLEDDQRLLQIVMECPVHYNMHGCPVRPPLRTTPSTTLSIFRPGWMHHPADDENVTLR